MDKIDVVKTDNGWAGKLNGRTVPNTKAPTKAETVKKVTGAAKARSAATSVRIHKADGKLQEERTYPRTADPRKTPG